MWVDALDQGRIGICAATEFEILFSARSADEYRDVKQQLADVYAWHAIPEDAWMRVLAIQEAMSRTGEHRAASVADLLVAITAQAHELTVLHYDHDFDTFARHTTVKTRWIAEPGTLD